VQHTTRRYHLPALGKNLADRVAGSAGHQSSAVDLSLLAYDEHLLRAWELFLLKAAQHHDANTLDLLRTGPGIGKILSRVLWYESHDIDRWPRVQEVASSGRLVKCAKQAAGKRSGPCGTNIGNAQLQWAFSEAAVLFLRDHPEAQTCLVRSENKPGTGKALTILAHKLARAVYSIGKPQDGL
jgi:transposase